MPWAPASPCSTPGCPHRRPCPLHHVERQRQYDQQRGKVAARGYGGRHRQLRVVVIARDPVCVICEDAASVVFDHVIPLQEGGESSLENAAGMCEVCHNRKRQLEGQARRGGVRLETFLDAEGPEAVLREARRRLYPRGASNL